MSESKASSQPETGAHSTVKIFERISEISGVGGWYYDVKTKELFWTDRTAVIHGHEPGYQTSIEDALTYFPEDSLKVILPIFEKAIDSGEPWDVELTIRTAKGEIRWVRSVGQMEYDADGTKSRLYGTFEDITERKESEVFLQQQQIRLNTIIEGTQVGTWEWNLTTGELIVNERWAAMAGYRLEELLPTTKDTWIQLVHPDDFKESEARLKECLEGRTDHYECECRMRHSEGHWVWVYANGAVASRTEDGKPLWLVGTHSDISASKELERQALLSSALRAGMMGTWTYDVQKDKFRFDDTFYRIFETTAEREGGEYMSIREYAERFLPPTTQPIVGEAIGKALSSTSPEYYANVEHPILRRNGSSGFVRVSFCILRNPRGEIDRIVGVNQDITESHRQRGILESQQAELQAINGELEEQTRLANAANLAKSTFLATMSHEIRTPLNAVIGMAELLEGTQLDEQQADYAHTIVGSSDALLGLINDILDYSKIESGKLLLERTAFDLNDAVTTPLKILTAQAFENKVALTYRIDPESPSTFMGDGARLRQVILNLLSNAIKFSKNGEVALSVRGSHRSARRWRLLFEVSDTGIGMDQAAQAQLFNPFVQANSSITREYGGSGLGLAICKRIIEQKGGEISVCSEPGKGSTFSFSIELEAARDSVRVGEEPDACSFSGKRVLIVKGPDNCLSLVGSQVESWGMHGALCEDADEAMATADEGEPYEIAIIDQQVADLDAARFARSLMDAGRVRHSILFSSSSADQNDQNLQAVFSAIFPKPINAKVLHLKLVQLLGLTIREKSSIEPTSLKDTVGGSPMTILIVDDNELNRKVIRATLENQGHTVHSAENGQEACEMTEQNDYPIIFMDVQMPVMDGLEATKKMRERIPDATKRPLIIALTANAMVGDREEYLAAGMDDYLSKPVRPRVLLECILKHFPSGGGKDFSSVSQNEARDEYAIIDEIYLEELLDSMPLTERGEFLGQLMEGFQQTSITYMEALNEAWSTGEPLKILVPVHSLKGASASIGFKRLSAYLQVLHDQLRDRNEVPPEDSRERLETLVEESIRALGSYLK